MKRTWYFHKKKFCTFSYRMQHKKCAELLWHILSTAPYEEQPLLLKHYFDIISWMQEGNQKSTPAAFENSRAALTHSYNWHCKEAETTSKEISFLGMDRENVLKPRLPYTIYLENLRSSHNIGSIIRTAEAFSLGTVALSNALSASKIVKSSMKAEKWIPILQEFPIEKLSKPIIAVETAPGALPYYEFIFPKEATIALGNEALGLSKKLLEKADYLITIPLYGRKHSINVANAFAIVAAEISRQQHGKCSA